MDSLELDKRLQAGSSVLISGIDEASGQRILQALKAFKATGRLSRHEQEGTSWLTRIWNPGLGVFAVSLILALLVKGVTGAVLALLGIAAVSAGIVLKGRRRIPVISIVPPAMDEDLKDLSRQYTAVIQQMSPEDSDILKSLAVAAFDIHRRLKSGSVAAVAAGGDTGELYDRLIDAVRTAVDIGRKLISAHGERVAQFRQELVDLRQLVIRTGEWFRTVEEKDIKSSQELNADLREVTRSIDRIIQDVRAPSLGLDESGEKLTR
jgi:hypothetical protein